MGDDCLNALSGSNYLSILDPLCGYWQVALEAEAKGKAAFLVQSRLVKWDVLPFKPISTPSTFKQLMENVLRRSSMVETTPLPI